jgi:hypothetical protein
MSRRTGFALAVALCCAAAPSAAQAAADQAPQREYRLSPAEHVALDPLLVAHGTAVGAAGRGETADWAAVEALLPAAEAAAQGEDARYLIARIQLGAASRANDPARQISALGALIGNPSTPPSELPTLLNMRSELAFAAEDFAAAERDMALLLQLSPGDERLIGNLAVVRRRMGNSSGAIELLLQTIAAREAAGAIAEEALYRRARDIAYTARDRRAAELARRLAQQYPTPANWRDAINVYRDAAPPAGAQILETLRFSRIVGALEGRSDWLAFADALHQAGQPGETRAVLDEAIAGGALRAQDSDVSRLLATADRRIAEDRGALAAQVSEARTDASARTARVVGDALYGYGRYREAAELYRLALRRGGEDPNLLNLRLGAALAMAGDRAAAESAFGLVGGQPADLARLWLAWLARRPG